VHPCGARSVPCVLVIAIADAGVVEQDLEARLAAAELALAAETKKGEAASARHKAEMEVERKANADALARAQKPQKVHGEPDQKQGHLAAWETIRTQGWVLASMTSRDPSKRLDRSRIKLRTTRCSSPALKTLGGLAGCDTNRRVVCLYPFKFIGICGFSGFSQTFVLHRWTTLNPEL